MKKKNEKKNKLDFIKIKENLVNVNNSYYVRIVKQNGTL